METETGIYAMVGTAPQYLHDLLFATEKPAQEAVARAVAVMAHGEIAVGQKFANAWQSGKRLVQD